MPARVVGDDSGARIGRVVTTRRKIHIRGIIRVAQARSIEVENAIYRAGSIWNTIWK
ncbi:MAG: hypothetical protein R3D26_07610 [Cyanobacteriota/Melainabacteria group bacterium]